MKYDDASWHYEGEFPEELPESAGATHIGMFFAWLANHGMTSDMIAGDIEPLITRQTSPATFVMEVLDEKLLDDFLSEEGNAFCAAYYDLQGGKFVSDYLGSFSKADADIYSVEDSWESYDLLAPVIDKRYQEWKVGKESIFGRFFRKMK